MKTQELKVSSFPIEKTEMYDKIGLGVNEFTGAQMAESAFDNGECTVKDEASPAAEYSTIKIYVTTQKELTNAVEKERGASFDFGFGSVEHHSTTITKTKISEKSLYLLINTSRSGVSKIFDFKNNNNNFTKDANSYIKDGKQEAFYTRYGSKYISKAKTGYYLHILLEFKCNSEEEVKSKKKELEATITSEDGTGKAKLSSNKEFKNFYSKNSGKLYQSHNIPPELIKEINGYETMSELDKLLRLSEQIELFQLDKASVIEYEITEKYPFYDTAFFGNFNNIVTELDSLRTQIEESQIELDTIKEFYKRPSIYVSVVDIDERQKFSETKLKSCQELAKLLVDNPWTKANRIVELRKITTAIYPYGKLKLRDAITTCIVSSSNKNDGYIILTDENTNLSSDSIDPMLSLGIALPLQIQNSGVSINYEVEFQKKLYDKNYNFTGYETKTYIGRNGSIEFCRLEVDAYVSRVTVWLTGDRFKKYNINLKGINSKGKPITANKVLSTEKVEFITIGSSNTSNSITYSPIGLISVYLSLAPLA